MTLTKDIAAKLAVASVAVAMVFSAFASTASAQTTEDLQQMINDLLAQVATLQSQIGQGGTSVAAGVCPYTWTRDLSSGSTGMDVMKLQQFLNADPDTQVSVSGAGSAGMETEYYGPATAAAVSKLQVKYRADILSPANLVNPTGYFGPGTRSKANSLCVAAPVVDDSSDSMPTDDSDDMMDDDDSDDSDSGDLEGEASLDTFKTSSASDDELQEGDEDAEIATVEVEFKDGDAEISRIDIALEGTGDEQDPWDVFETISLWVDGDKIAEENADDRDDYLDEDDGSLRFSGLDLIAREDDQVEITVAATLQNNLDGVNDGEDWTVEFDAMRYFDADGVASTDTTTGDLGDATGESFSIVEAGNEDEVIVKSSDNDPDATTLELDDSTKSDWYTVFAFDLDTDDSENDIELNEVQVSVTVSSSTFDFFVDDYELVIDGTTIDDLVAAYTDGATVVLRFDVDGDVTIDAGDRVEAELRLRFNSLNTGDEGVTVMAEVTTANANAIDAEGADDLDNTSPDQLRGSATGDEHTLRTSGLAVTDFEVSSDVDNKDTSADSTASFVFEFSLEVVGDDEVYVPLNTAVYDAAGSTTKGSVYRIEDSNGDLYASSSATSLSAIFQYVGGGGDTDTAGYLHLDSGEVADVKLSITMDPGAAGYYTAILDSIGFSASAAPASNSLDLEPATDYDETTDVSVAN